MYSCFSNKHELLIIFYISMYLSHIYKTILKLKIRYF